MLKKLSVFFLLFSFVSIQSVWAQSLLKYSKEEALISDQKVKLNYQTVYNDDPQAVLFDNGPLVTLPAGGCSGGDASILDGNLGHTTYGWGAQQNLTNFIADDFTSIAAWNIDSLHFFTYQTGATASTITGVYVQIWSGDPTAGGTVVWGDQTTNRLQRTGFSNVYRALNTTPTDCNRRIQDVVATVGVNLPAGTYWIEWGYTGTLASGPWCPPVTISGQAVTGNAKQHLAGVWSEALNGTSANGAPFIVYGTSGAPCPVGSATNPNPVNGATDVDVNLSNLSWTNGSGTTQIEVFFGEAGNMVSVYSVAPQTTYTLSSLSYATDYQWKVVCKDDTCSALADTWSFTTITDPNLVSLLYEDFETGGTNWTITNDGGTCTFTVAPITQNGYTLPPSATGSVLSADADFCGSGSTTLGTATFNNPIDASLYQTVTIEFDNDWQAIDNADFSYVEVSTDNANWIPVRTFDVTDVRNTHEFIDISSSVALQSFYLRLRTVQPGWDWWWAVDNISVIGSNIVPVELTSFAANVNDNDVTLNWSTATETNNSGFQVERNNGSGYEVIGFVAGHGTTTEIQSYSFVDKNIGSGNYSYRLKQIDYNGTYSYSNTVEAEIVVKEYSLSQNYPNPFNPSTIIRFSLMADSKVSLKIFDVLGQEVATLINGQMSAGSQTVNFDASHMNSGVYFYRLDADGVDGQKFSSTKKMILTK